MPIRLHFVIGVFRSASVYKSCLSHLFLSGPDVYTLKSVRRKKLLSMAENVSAVNRNTETDPVSMHFNQHDKPLDKLILIDKKQKSKRMSCTIFFSILQMVLLNGHSCLARWLLAC